MPPRRTAPRVALLIETTRTYSREILSGIRRYISVRGPWSTFLELRALDSSPPKWLRNWKGDGILTRTFTRQMARVVEETGLPAVELRSTHLAGNRPFVGMDNAQIGRMVAEHFHTCGYRHFATYGLATEKFFVERMRNFTETAAGLGSFCTSLEARSDQVEDWEQSQKRLTDWVAGLPKPIGIFAANDQLGVHLLEACQRAGVGVPEELGVVGAENEEALCSFATPALSSVRFDGDAVGFAAAELLDSLMQGAPPPSAPLLIAPKGIVIRRSSDELVIHDALVARAVRVIRENALNGIDVTALCQQLRASRSTLDRRMKAALQRTPKEEIDRVRFREVERLLRETDLTVEAIAELTGFVHPHYLHAAFKELHGMTPGAFRVRHLPDSSPVSEPRRP